MINDHLKDLIKNLPQKPGVYKFLNRSDKIIYIGKAKNLKKRVASYFNRSIKDEKTNTLVSKINSFSIVLVKSETDALLLENNLIKKIKPKYNILLKDGFISVIGFGLTSIPLASMIGFSSGNP